MPAKAAFKPTEDMMLFTGERAIPLAPNMHPGIMQEHWARYEFAAPLVEGKRVLDVACGAGYGSDLLAGRAEMVVGGDISEEVIEYSQAHYRRDNLRFEVMDIRAIPYPDKSFDVITSFETIEHIAEGDQFLREVTRLLAPGGSLILSTPLGEPVGNSYHLAHYRQDTFKAYLSRFFESVNLLYQRGDTFYEASSDPCYGLAVCQKPKQQNTGLTSIIIAVYNQLDYTRQCLESIEAYTPEPHELIIVDNGSTDDTADYLNGYLAAHPNTWVIRNPNNLGYAAANNQGISRAGGEYILLLNNDTLVTPGWLGRMLAVLEQYPDVGLVGPMTNYASGWQMINGVKPDDLASHYAGRSTATHRLVGFCLLARREVFEQIGLLDEQFGPGNFDDDDFCIRAYQAGFKARVALDTFVYHKGHATFNGNGLDYKDIITRNWELFKGKWGLPVGLEYGQTNYWPYVVKPSVGVAMMARNNAAEIPLALEPFLGKVDEIAILLGGKSTDNTAEVARKMAGVVGNYDGPLDEEGGLLDFGLARQQSFDLLDTDWVIWVEPDDRWQGVEKLRELVAEAEGNDYQGVMFPHDLGASAFLQGRLLRRDSGHWAGPIHETWKYYDAPQVRVLHTDTLKARQEKPAQLRKASAYRNIRIAEGVLSTHFDFRLLTHVSREYVITGQYDKAIEAAERLLDNLDLAGEENTPDNLFQINYTLGLAHLCLENFTQAVSYAAAALASAARFGYGWALLAEAAYHAGIYELVLFAADQALRYGRPLGILPSPYANISSAPYHLKAKALVALERKYEAVAALELGLAMKANQEMTNLKYELCNELGLIP